MDFYEEVVLFCLTASQQLLVLPQAAIKSDLNGKLWKADIDFVAVDFRSQRIMLVEVSSHTNFPEKVAERLAEINCLHIENFVKAEILCHRLDDYQINWRLIVRQRHKDKLENHRHFVQYKTARGHCEVIPLEDYLDQLKLNLA